ncbi:MAG: hypothetical protein ACK5Y2_10850 [Bdellovibrionales bacterium]
MHIQKIRTLLRVQSTGYMYYMHVEFPDLEKSCWQKSSSGNLEVLFPEETNILIRLSTLDEKESNLLDVVPVRSLKVQSTESSDFQKLETPRSTKQNAKVTVFYSQLKNASVLVIENLRLPMASEYLKTEFLKANP